MDDPVLKAFLARQREDAAHLAAQSDRLDLVPVEGRPPQRYIACFHARGLIQDEHGRIAEAERFDVGIWLPDDYLRRAEVTRVLTYLGPHRRPWHPNIRPPLICAHLRPATPLVELLYVCHELWTWNLFATGDDGLNPAASQWARRQSPGRFPVDRRPLKRRALHLDVDVREEAQQ